MMTVEQLDNKFIVEIRKDYTTDKDGQFMGGTWEVLKDEFDCERVFDFYTEAYRILKAKCSAVEMFGHSVGRVKEVVMVDRKNKDTKNDKS